MSHGHKCKKALVNGSNVSIKRMFNDISVTAVTYCRPTAICLI